MRVHTATLNCAQIPNNAGLSIALMVNGNAVFSRTIAAQSGATAWRDAVRDTINNYYHNIVDVAMCQAINYSAANTDHVTVTTVLGNATSGGPIEWRMNNTTTWLGTSQTFDFSAPAAAVSHADVLKIVKGLRGA